MAIETPENVKFEHIFRGLRLVCDSPSDDELWTEAELYEDADLVMSSSGRRVEFPFPELEPGVEYSGRLRFVNPDTGETGSWESATANAIPGQAKTDDLENEVATTEKIAPNAVTSTEVETVAVDLDQAEDTQSTTFVAIPGFEVEITLAKEARVDVWYTIMAQVVNDSAQDADPQVFNQPPLGFANFKMQRNGNDVPGSLQRLGAWTGGGVQLEFSGPVYGFRTAFLGAVAFKDVLTLPAGTHTFTVHFAVGYDNRPVGSGSAAFAASRVLGTEVRKR